mgnify:CR=1 FL=1
METELKFPINVLPPLLRNIISETHKALNFPVAYIAMSLLTAIATAIGDTCWLKVKTEWLERPLMYVALLGNPGSVKSHPMKFAMKPILERDIQSRKLYSEQLKEYRKRLKAGEDPPKPKCRQRIVQDVTMEGLCKILEDNSAGLCLWSDELANWLGSMDKYRKGGNDVGTWLSIFNAQPIFVDRKGVDDKITIARPFVNVIGSIQPKVFAKYFSGQLRHNGLLSRILVIFNDDQDKMPYDSYMDVPEELVERWRNLIDAILDLTDGYYEFGEAVYTLSEDAKAAFSTWSDRNTDAVNEEADKTICEFFQKIKNYVYRFALILQILEEIMAPKRSDRIVHSGSMIFATVIGDYLMDNARRVIELLDLSDDSGGIRKSFQLIYENLPEKFAKAQVNEVATRLKLSPSTADKFCQTLLQKQMLIRDGIASYRKI